MSSSPELPASSKLRVCHVAYTFHESDLRVMRYVRALAERGDRVDVVALRPAGGAWLVSEPNAQVYQVQRRATTEKAAWVYLAKLLLFWFKAMCVVSALQLRRRYDMVHVHNVPDFLVFTAWLPKLMGACLILDIHDMMPELYAGKFAQGEISTTFRALAVMERLACGFADHVIASNDLWYGTLTARSVSPERCTVFINHPDLTLFTPATRKPDDAGPFVFLYPGSLNRHQGVDLAVEAFAEARTEMPGAELHIYGRGPALPELHELVRRHGLGASVQLRDFLPAAQIADLMRRADVGVVPKRADGFGNEAFSTKILEFMASGVPVIVARTRIDDYYFDEGVVSFFEPGNSASLARAMVEAYTQPSQLAAKAEAARVLAGRLSWQAQKGHYTRLVDELTGVARSAPMPS